MKNSPRTVYLPSSGGYTSSRIVPESIDRRRFPFRRYSIDDDGNLVCRSRNINREARPRPYDTLPRVVTGEVAHRSTTPAPSRPHGPTSDSGTASRLLNDLMSAVSKDPEAFRASIPAVSAEYSIDPVVLEALIAKAMEAQRARRVQDAPPASDQPSDQPSVAPSISISPVPFKRERPFPSGGRGMTVWYTTQSSRDISTPQPGLHVAAGDLYIHTNTGKQSRQIWLFGLDATWKFVSDIGQTSHPSHRDRFLSICSDGTPNWVSPTTTSCRKDKPRRR